MEYQALAGALGGAVVILAQVVWRLVSGPSNGKPACDPALRETLARLSDLLDRQAATDERTAALLDQLVRLQERAYDKLDDIHRLTSRTLDAVRRGGSET